MKVTVAIVRVNGKDQYNETIKRWLDSYIRFRPTIEHEVLVVDRYQDNPDGLFDSVASRHVRYDGLGWDVGTWQFLGQSEHTDLLVCFNSRSYITGPNWLNRFVDSVQSHGKGLYGPLSSLEVAPHIRTPCMIFQPEVIRGYPVLVDTREKTYQFESMGFGHTPNFTLWCRQKGYKTMLVTWDGCYDLPDWRRPDNIFRRGNQSNCIVKDGHCDLYENSPGDYKAMLERMANGR